MKNELKIGLIIADDMEYAAYEELVADKAKENNFFARKGHRYELTVCNKKIIIDSVLCGIGTVNAATAAMYLVDNGADILLNYGLSGGVSSVSRGEDVVGVSFLEYDFDLTCCGYKACEKPAQEYIYYANELLSDIISNQGGGLKKCNLASGDRFVSDPVLRDALKNDFLINACDMETAAIASVCDMADIPYLSIRRVSDDAGDDAYSNYKEMNIGEGQTLSQIFLDVLDVIIKEVV